MVYFSRMGHLKSASVLSYPFEQVLLKKITKNSNCQNKQTTKQRGLNVLNL